MSTKLNSSPWSWILILTGLMVIACIDVIDLDTSGEGGVLIIEGTVFSGGQPAMVEVRESAAFEAGAGGVELPISGASVSIEEVGHGIFELLESQPGIYRASQIFGVPGREYKLRVEVNGNVYLSRPEKLPPRVPIDSLGWSYDDVRINNAAGNVLDQRIFKLKATSDLSPFDEDIFLRYRISGIWEFQERTTASNPFAIICYIPDAFDFNNLAIVDGRTVRNDDLNNEIIIEKVVDHKFAFNFCLTVVQQSITLNAYNFWRSVKNEFERTGDIFEAPPARILGNIFNEVSTRNDVIGLFSTISTDTMKININGLQFDPPPNGQCRGFGISLPEECTDCLQIMNSTTSKPECL